MPSRRVTAVTGKFDDQQKVDRAVELLAEHDVPASDIEVVLVDQTGFHERDVSVRDQKTVARRVTVGLALGAVLGAAAPLLLSLDALGPVDASWIRPGLGAAVQAGVVGAAIAGALTALLELARRRSNVGVAPEETEEGSVLVSVRGEAHASAARRIMRDAGAEHLSG